MNVSILEGFDYVGKTAVRDILIKSTMSYRPSYEFLDNYVGRDKAWMLGYGCADFLRYLKGSGLEVTGDIVLDRSPISSYVYSRIYEDQDPISRDITLEFVKILSESVSSINIYYTTHTSRSSAQYIYENAPGHNDPMDYFKTFDEYLSMHTVASKEYYYILNDIYNLGLSNVHIIVARTKSDETGRIKNIYESRKWRNEYESADLCGCSLLD